MPTMTPPAVNALAPDDGVSRREAVRISASTEPPRDGAPGEHSLAPGALRYRTILGAVAILAVGAIATALTLLLVHEPGWRLGVLIAVAVFVVLSAVTDLLVLNRIEVRSTSYTATPDFVYVARGRWFRRTTVVATTQILNVEIAQGPLLRSLGLVKVTLTRIADEEAISPLTPAAASELQSVVLGAQRDDADA